MSRLLAFTLVLNRGCAHDRIRRAWLLFFLAGGLVAAERTPNPLDEWRNEAARIRLLAENDAPLAYAQAQQLQSSLPAGATAADRARALNVLARAEIYVPLTTQAETHARAALAIARQSGDRVGQAEADLNLAVISVDLAKIDQLVEVTNDSVKVLEGVDRPDLLGEALLRTALTSDRLGKLEDSVAMCVQAMEIARRSNNRIALLFAHQGLAMSFARNEHNREASEHFAQMRVEAQAVGWKLLVAHATCSQGGELAVLGETERAEAMIKEGIAGFRAVGVPFAVNAGLLGLAHFYIVRGRHSEARPIYDEVIASYARLPNKMALWWTLSASSTNHLALGELGAARADADRSRVLAGEIGLPFYLGESAQRLAALAAKQGDFEGAYRFKLEAEDIAAKAAREKSNARIMELVTRYESESEQRHIAELTRRNEQQAAELRQHGLERRWLWTVLGGSGLALVGAAFFIARQRRAAAEIRALNTGLEQRVRERTAALELANKELEAFSYSVSHDLRTPLRSIDGFSLALVEDYAPRLDAEGLDCLQRVRAASQRMGRLIDDMLEFSRAARAELRHTPLDVSALAHEIADDLARAEPERRVTWTIAPGLVAHADPPMMRTALQNLLGNAWKFTGRLPQAHIEVGRTEIGGEQAFFVRDDGAGFDMAFAEKLFGPFQRLHTTEEFSGTGIGLANVQRIIHRHGGRVWARGEVGRGATFFFTLPEPTPESQP